MSFNIFWYGIMLQKIVLWLLQNIMTLRKKQEFNSNVDNMTTKWCLCSPPHPSFLTLSSHASCSLPPWSTITSAMILSWLHLGWELVVMTQSLKYWWYMLHGNEHESVKHMKQGSNASGMTLNTHTITITVQEFWILNSLVLYRFLCTSL